MILGLEFWAITFDFVGKFLVALTVLLTHRRVAIEKHIDKLVIKDLRLEINIGIIAMIFIIMGYVLHLLVLKS